MRKNKILTQHYAIEGNSVFRQLFHWLRLKTSLMGNFDTGPGLKNLLTLILVHYFGRGMFWIRTWLRNHHHIRTGVKKIIRRDPK